MNTTKIKTTQGRGAQYNSDNPFLKHRYDYDAEDTIDEPTNHDSPTQILNVSPKTILNKVESTDIPFEWSMNPYQGCEHGCVYCYARYSHTYWGYSAGIDFEKKILIKENAAELLAQKLSSKKWEARPIMLSGNTDCYQPIERKKKITRQILKVLLRYKHPVSIITKNALVLRDLDLLKELAKHKLVKVNLSVTTLNEDLRRFLEPRTSTGARRLMAVKKLVEEGIPTNVMLAPIIPSLNSYEIPELVKKSAEAGAHSISYQMVRLRGGIYELFEDWINRTYPDRAAKVLSQIKSIHAGHTTSSEYGKRMKGEGEIARSIQQMFHLSKKKYFDVSESSESKKDDRSRGYNLDLYHPSRGDDQLRMF